MTNNRIDFPTHVIPGLTRNPVEKTSGSWIKSRMTKKIFTYSLIGLFTYSIIGLFNQVSALTMSNSNYIIQMGNLNSFAGSKSNGQYTLNDTGGQLGPGLYSGSGFKVRSGFQYISSIVRFRFAIDSTEINFGTLTATNPVTRNQTLTVNTGSAYGYAVTLSENHQLMKFPTGELIPNTTCDDGSCTTIAASVWTNTLTYGFGYRCDSGTDCASGFGVANSYKQVPDLSLSQSPATVMTGTTVGKNRQVTLKYKVNISGTQAAGLYVNELVYVATPTY
jgi:hypothetical protein